jgi:hypothetical protein
MTGRFHEGELAVQQRAQLSDRAARLEQMLEPTELDAVIKDYLVEQTMAIVTGRGVDGALWTTAIRAPAGFLDTDGPTLFVNAAPRAGDPLEGLSAGQDVGVLVIDLRTRRRLRINGLLLMSDPQGLEIEVEQAYGNCRRYIVPQPVEAPAETGARTTDPIIYDGPVLRPEHLAWIASAQTMFVGSTHPTRGADASHRGGPEGFVRAEPGGLWWPDYPGNNMFNTLGNIAVDPRVSCLFVDLDRGRSLHLTGTAAIDWDPHSRTDVPEAVERGVALMVERVIEVAR